MFRVGVVTVFLLLPASLGAQMPEASLGLTLAKIPEALYAQMPPLAKNHGVLVEAVEPNSPAWRGGLRRYDIIMSLDSAKSPADVNAVAEKLKRAKLPKVTVLRAGREVVLAFDASRKDAVPEKDLLAPKSYLKAGGPPAVTVQVQPLDDGQLNLVLTFYSANSGKLESLTCDGTIENIESQIHSYARDQRLPERVQDLVEVALKRVRNNISQNQR
jgi:hypothetical protein